MIHEVVVSCELTKAVLPTKFVEPRHATLAVANQIQRCHIDLMRLAFKSWHPQLLQELRMIVECQQSQALSAHAEGRIGQTDQVHDLSGFAATGRYERHPCYY